MNAERLERAARALFDVRDFEWSGHAEVDGHRGFYQACPSCGGLRPDMAPSSLKNLHGHGKRCRLVALRAALSAHEPSPKQADVPMLLRQAYRCGYSACGAGLDVTTRMDGDVHDILARAAQEPAQAGEAVAS